MKDNTKRIEFEKDLQYGLFLGVDGKEYMFNYGTDKDNGLGSVTIYPSNEEFEIMDDERDELGNMKAVIVKLNK